MPKYLIIEGLNIDEKYENFLLCSSKPMPRVEKVSKPLKRNEKFFERAQKADKYYEAINNTFDELELLKSKMEMSDDIPTGFIPDVDRIKNDLIMLL